MCCVGDIIFIVADLCDGSVVHIEYATNVLTDVAGRAKGDPMTSVTI